MSFQAIVTKGTPLKVRKEVCDRPVQPFNLQHQLASLDSFVTERSVADGKEWSSLPMTEANADVLINTINTPTVTGGKRYKRKRPKTSKRPKKSTKSKKLKYFYLKRK